MVRTGPQNHLYKYRCLCMCVETYYPLLDTACQAFLGHTETLQHTHSQIHDQLITVKDV